MNIEILEDFIKQYNTKYPQEIKIIKILMQENKKLLTKLQEHKCIETVFKPLYIPKSKVKEKIEYYEEMKKTVPKEDALFKAHIQSKIEALQELLEEGE